MKYRMLVAIMTLGICAVATAHHSYAEFDMSKKATVSGTIAKVEWVNPHAFVWMYVPKQQGGHALYAFENGSPAMLRRFGWNKDTLPTGEKVTIHYHPLLDGRSGGSFIKAVHADGRTTDGDPYAPGGAQHDTIIRNLSPPKGSSK